MGQVGAWQLLDALLVLEDGERLGEDELGEGVDPVRRGGPRPISRSMIVSITLDRTIVCSLRPSSRSRPSRPSAPRRHRAARGRVGVPPRARRRRRRRPRPRGVPSAPRGGSSTLRGGGRGRSSRRLVEEPAAKPMREGTRWSKEAVAEEARVVEGGRPAATAPAATSHARATPKTTPTPRARRRRGRHQQQFEPGSRRSRARGLGGGEEKRPRAADRPSPALGSRAERVSCFTANCTCRMTVPCTSRHRASAALKTSLTTGHRAWSRVGEKEELW